MKVRYITIEREYGSAGTQIAAAVAEKCGIPSYGREILEAVAQRQDVPVSALEQYEERVSGSFLYSMFVMSQSQTGDPDLVTPEVKLYVAETRQIREMAEQGPGIFVGHCACHALKEQEGVLRVFIRSDEKTKRERIIRDYHIDPQQADSVSRRVNRRRANYYSFCTRKKWNDLSNYDLVLDSSRLGVEGCASVLAAAFGTK